MNEFEKLSSEDKKKSLDELSKNGLIGLKNKFKELSLKDKEKMARELDEDRDRYFHFQSSTMTKVNESTEKKMKKVSEMFRNRLADEKLTVDTIDRVFNELITDAYLDRGVAYSITVGSILEKIEKLQAIRQKADSHLVRLIRAFVEIKRPLIKVFVRRLDQLNVSDKQVNISQKNTNDLDKNNEKFS